MGQYIPVCLAELFAIKAIAFLVLGLIAYLYWLGVKEKRAQRREREWLENRRRELRAKTGNKSGDE
jgi:threonine/homoserine/homoserine lactone efflux protein